MAVIDFVSVDNIEQLMNDVIDWFLIPRFQGLGMRATGDWEKGLEAVAEPNRGIIKGLDYTEQLVHGQGPTTVPISDLKRWAKAKFRLSDNAALAVAHRVQNKIKREGTSWYEKGGSNLIEVFEEPVVINFINTRLREIVTPRITDILIRQMRDTWD